MWDGLLSRDLRLFILITCLLNLPLSEREVEQLFALDFLDSLVGFLFLRAVDSDMLQLLRQLLGFVRHL